ncbi:MAG: PDZ domain-containing protein [Verrucomicrobiota bacterium]
MVALLVRPTPGIAQEVTNNRPHILAIKSEFIANREESTIVNSLGFMVETDGFLLCCYEQIIDPASGELSHSIQVISPEIDDYEPQPASIIGVEPTLNFAVLKIDTSDELRKSQLADEILLTKYDAVGTYRLRDEEIADIEGEFLQMNELECYQQSLTGSMMKARLGLDQSSFGAPVFDASGEVIAVYTGYEPIDPSLDENEEQGDYLLPITLANTVYQSIKERQSLESPWTGFSVSRLSDEERSIFPLNNGQIKGGIRIEHIWEGGPAEGLGIQSGDILVKFAHNPVESVGDFQKWLYLYGVGQSVKLYLIRDRKELVIIEYTIEKRPDWARPE